MKKPALGRGLEAILGGTTTGVATAGGGAGSGLMFDAPRRHGPEVLAGARIVEIEKVSAGRGQPRRKFAEGPLEELANSIREQGLIQPIVVTERPGGYELVAGERRLRAAARAGLERIPVVIKNHLSERDLLELALVENLQREDLTPLEEGRAFQRLIVEHGLTQEQVAKRVGKSRAAVANTVRLLALPEPVREAIEAELISEGHARALLGLTTAAAQIKAARTITRKNLSVRETEALVKAAMNGGGNGNNGKGSDSRATVRDSQVVAMEQSLSRSLGTKVRIKAVGVRGRIEIDFYSEAELSRLTQRLSS
ncbi:MAG: ParB/RepB/Spo0J family partition protein [Deltaproteobacteria bacterium]